MLTFTESSNHNLSVIAMIIRLDLERIGLKCRGPPMQCKLVFEVRQRSRRKVCPRNDILRDPGSGSGGQLCLSLNRVGPVPCPNDHPWPDAQNLGNLESSSHRQRPVPKRKV